MLIFLKSLQREIERDRQTETEAEKDRDRDRQRQTDRHTDINIIAVHMVLLLTNRF